jgi:hypothetical protein
MADNNVFIDLDFFPPTAERLFKLPGILKERGVQKICMKMICNFPWEFEPRMRSESFFPENVTAHFFKLCSDAGIRLSFLFPGTDDFGRILRLPGYSRLACPDCDILYINPESTGIKSFIESIFEDVVSLIPDIRSFTFRGREGFDRITAECAVKSGYSTELLPPGKSSFYVEEIFESADKSMIKESITGLSTAIDEFEKTVFKIKQYAVMGSLCCNAPSSGSENAAELYRSMKIKKKNLDKNFDVLRREGSVVIDDFWLKKYLSSISLVVNEDFTASAMRLKQLGLLRDT